MTVGLAGVRLLGRKPLRWTRVVLNEDQRFPPGFGVREPLDILARRFVELPFTDQPLEQCFTGYLAIRAQVFERFDRRSLVAAGQSSDVTHAHFGHTAEFAYAFPASASTRLCAREDFDSS